MAQTPRDIVRRCLTFQHPERMPVQIWRLPWADQHIPEVVAEIDRRWPGDIGYPASPYRPSPRVHGNPHAEGEYVDEWGCTFLNLQAGVIGEVKAPLVADLDDWERLVQPPYETLPETVADARDSVNRACAASDKFMMSGCCPRPWERYQFLRGTENAMMDFMDPDERVQGVLRRIHDFHLKEVEFWASTDVDAISFMDDWGSQRQLLLPPRVWREWFKPLYKEYCDLAHAHGKFVFMHSDGHLSEIFDDLIEVGVNALNSQLFCMDMADLARRGKGKIAFWGEIDRQHVLPAKDPAMGRWAVREVANHLYDPAGGVFVQFEMSPGAHGPTVIAVMEEWDAVQREHGRCRPA